MTTPDETQITDAAQLSGMSAAEINEARRAGRIDHLLNPNK